MKTILLLLSLLSFQTIIAQWTNDVTVNTAICTAADDQTNTAIVSDGSGGAIIVWSDNRSGNYDIYAQRVNAAGITQWTANGVAVCIAGGNQFFPVVISDGNGGAIITWTDYRNDVSFNNTDIFAQKINAAGEVQWTANGIAVCNNNTNQRSPRLALFGNGGAVVVWSDDRNGTNNSDIYAQRINPDGSFAWTVNGIVVCNATSFQSDPALISDGSNATFITWLDNRSGTYNVYAQRLDAAGAAQWTANGTGVCIAGGFKGTARIVSDGSTGAIISWEDARSGNADVYAQKLNASGVAQWTSNGVVVSNASNLQSQPELIADQNGGAILFWLDYRNGTDFSVRDLYAQRIDATGISLWTNNGLAICTAPTNQQGYKLVSDGMNGAFFTWFDNRSGTNDVYMQYITAAGTAVYANNGIIIGGAADNQEFPAIASDGAFGAIAAWADKRGGVANDIYAHRIVNTTIPTSVSSRSAERTIEVYPNPIKAQQPIVVKHAKALVAIYGSNGKRYAAPVLNTFAEVQTIQLPALPRGLYMLEFKNKNNKLEFIKIAVY
jgi:hypothetical protein